MLDIVLDYAATGWQVFPLQPNDKIPLAGSNGFKDGTTNPATLRRWWGRGFPYNVGIRTGLPSGIWVLDLDGEAGFVSLAELEAEHGPLPPTLTSFTANGCHLWFKATAEMPCSASKIGEGIDVRADGGYVAAPPSVHPDGPLYRWGNALPPAEAPQWLVRLAHQREAAQPPTAPAAFLSPPRIRRCSEGYSAWAQSALDREADDLAMTAPGNRNDKLNCVAFRMHQIVAAGLLASGEVVERLLQAITANGLLDEDGIATCMATIRSGAAAGLLYPRGPAND